MRTFDAIRRITYSIMFPRDILFCKYVGLNWDPTWRFYGLPKVQKKIGTNIIVGKHFTLVSDMRYNSIGVFQPVILKTTGTNARIVIGNNVGMSGCTVSANRLIQIGNNVMIGSGCLITDNDAHPIHPCDREFPERLGVAEVVIEDDAFLGARVIVLKGVIIGKGSVIGAGSVVVHDIPSMVIAAGNPATVIREL